jgi:hypothetical protein
LLFLKTVARHSRISTEHSSLRKSESEKKKFNIKIDGSKNENTGIDSEGNMIDKGERRKKKRDKKE